LVDGGDAGDEYTYSPPAADLVVDRPSEAPRLTVRERGPSRSTLRVEMTYLVPEALSEDRQSRSDRLVPLPVSTWVHLYPGIRRIDVRTEIENTARDHRLRVHFPTPIRTRGAHADGHFAVVSRSVEPPTGDHDWLEHPSGTYPQRRFVDVSDGQVGLLLANRGLPEYDVVVDERGEACMALTLLRCVGWLSRDDLQTRRGGAGPALPTPGAQMLGRFSFEYALAPHPDGWERAMLEAHWFGVPMRATMRDLHPGSLPSSCSLLAVEPAEVLVSAVKLPAEGGGVIVRLVNVLAQPVEARLKPFRPVGRAEICNLNEEPVRAAAVDPDGRLTVALRSQQAVTLRLFFEAGSSTSNDR
jgi:alpha-mannosidase